MANRNFANGGKIMSMHVAPVIANTTVLIGATGAVTSFLGTLTASVTRISTGIYQINLTNNFNVHLFSQGSMLSPVSGLSGVATIEIQNAPTTSVSNLAAPSITVKCLAPAGTVVDPAVGSSLSVMTFLNNSSVKA